MGTLHRPANPGERIESLDVMRGIALLGILVMNMPGFSSSFFLPEAVVREKMGEAGPLDAWVHLANAALLEGKFNGLFTLLFGMGLALQFRRLPGPDGAAVVARRLMVLLAFGVAHTALLWHGDVLHIYAVLGVALWIVKDWRPGFLLALALALLLAQFAHGLVMAAHWTVEGHQAEQSALAGLLALDDAIYGSGTWWDGVGLRLHESWAFYANGYLWPLSLWFWLALLTTAVLGLWAQRTGWLVEGDGPTRWLASPAGLRGLVLLFLTALGLWLLSADLSAEHDSTEAPTPEILLSGMLVDTHRVLMVLCYAGLILRWCAVRRASGLRRQLARVGRMPLTMYLMQSLMGTFIFHGWGLGLWDQLGPAALTALAVALFLGVQVPLARWWLSRHEMGPAEALWRRLSYGRP